MNFKIRTSTVYIEQLLSRIQGTSGHLHSIYRRTINLSAGEHLIALQAAGSPVSPISLITELTGDEMSDLGICAGDSVRFLDGYLELNSAGTCHTFSLAGCTFHNTRLTTVLSDSDLSQLSDNIKKALSLVNTNGFDAIFNNRIADGASLMILAARNRIQQCSSLYSAGKYNETGTELARLIGLGIGLTPSGDDFLCGVLAGLQLSGRITHPLTLSLKDAIVRHLSSTVDVSAAFLACAVEGEFSLAVGSLTKLPDPEQIARTFTDIGHSSGVDTLCGIWYALQTLCL